MATPLAKAEKHHAERKRVVIFVPIEMGYLLDLISRYELCTKRSLHERVWEAGVKSLLGIDPASLETSQPSPLPRSTKVPKELHKLVSALVRDGQA